MAVVQYRMRLTILLLALGAVHTKTKRLNKEESTKSTPDLPKNAIIAIEVVDPKENSTKDGHGRKRTIESALGYGYNGGYENFFDVKPKPPKYEVYKYSQHDIPAYKGSTKNIQVDGYQKYHHTAGNSAEVHEGPTGGGHASTADATSYSHQDLGLGIGNDYQVQKSIQYDVGSTVPAFEPSQIHQIQSQHGHHGQPGQSTAKLQQYYQKGATLFSSLDHNGHLSSLSSQAPTNHGPMVPVIILRVYTNQLGQNALYANIPPGHPFAKLNSIDLQSLLAGYVQNHPQGGHQQYYGTGPTQIQHQPQQEYYQSAPGSVEVNHGHAQTHYQLFHSHPTHNNHDQTHGHQHHATSLQTNENYPDDAHTKVIFKKPAHAGSKSRIKQTRPPQKFKLTIPENTYSKVEVQEHIYGGAHDAGQYVQQQVHYAQAQGQAAGQQYYYQQQYQHQPQQEYQSSVQSVVQYQQVPASGEGQKYLQQDHQTQEIQKEHDSQLKSAQEVQAGKQVLYGPPQEVVHAPQQEAPQPQTHYYPQHYDAKQYVQIATYPTNTNPEEHQTGHDQQQDPQSYQAQLTQHQQSQQPQQIPVEYYQQYLQYQPHTDQTVQSGYEKPTGTEVQYLQRSPEQGTENQDYSIVKHSNDAGRDLHPKLYNYHAHDGAPKKKRSRKQRKSSRVPLVLAPEVMETIEKKQ